MRLLSKHMNITCWWVESQAARRRPGFGMMPEKQIPKFPLRHKNQKERVSSSLISNGHDMTELLSPGFPESPPILNPSKQVDSYVFARCVRSPVFRNCVLSSSPQARNSPPELCFNPSPLYFCPPPSIGAGDPRLCPGCLDGLTPRSRCRS